MRLVCPNCDAQYEISPDAIPESGRDVQCSNCGHTWFQAHHDASGADGEEGAHWPGQEGSYSSADGDHDAAGGEDGGEDRGGEATDLAAGDVYAAPDPEDEDSEPGDQGEDENAATSEAPAGELPPRRPLDQGVADILRQEAERERQVRETEQSAAIETQPELGIDDAGQAGEAVAATVAHERVARLRGNNPEPVADTEPGKRRDLLPDIEEINSTLRPASDRDGEEDADAEKDPVRQKRRRRGFRMGFGLVTILAALMLLLYQKAPVVVERLPQSAPYMTSYVQWVNDKRLLLDQWALDAAAKLSPAAGASQ